jgi:hypothetical protein
MMMQEVPALEEPRAIMNLAEMITEVDAEKQCAKIASWLKEHFPVQGIALSLHESSMRKPYLHTENVPKDIFKQIHKFFREYGQQVAPRDEIMAFSLKEGECYLLTHKGLPSQKNRLCSQSL